MFQRFVSHCQRSAGLVIFLALLFSNAPASQANSGLAMAADKARVIEHWTKERRALAIPRDLLIDKKGRGYLRKPDGSLVPYGEINSAQIDSRQKTPQGKPGGDTDNIAPVISAMSPADGSIIGQQQVFSATIMDDSGIKSVSFVITYPDGITTQSFTPVAGVDNIWSVSLQGFSDGDWQWHVVAKDSASRGGNTAVSEKLNFSVDSGGTSTGGGGNSSYIVTNSNWSGGDIQAVSGRIYFEMPGNAKLKGPWSGYVCSGTVAEDSISGRSIILTAAHCVYDDANKAFARNVLFIPNQAQTSGSGTDTNCNNDPMGCWVPSFGVVDANWTSSIFPENIAWDYAYYVVSDSGAHVGTAAPDSLDQATGSMPVSFFAVNVNDGDPSAGSVDFTHAFGYSYSNDPDFMYCAEDMTTEGDVNWWLPSCGLSGGASGGAWLQSMDQSLGRGSIVSVNSWGYTTAPGMAGPKLTGTSAECLFTEAKYADFSLVTGTDGHEGFVIQHCP